MSKVKSFVLWCSAVCVLTVALNVQAWADSPNTFRSFAALTGVGATVDWYTEGPFTATGQGANEQEAEANALDAMNAQVQTLNDNLPPGEQVVFVMKDSGTWDGTTFTYTYMVVIERT